MALNEVDLLWVPANWPETGGLDPVSIWRARVIENGIYLAACNRTGKDIRMDCTKAISGVFSSDGKELFKGSSETIRIFYVDIPLDKEGRFAGIKRNNKMANRNIDHYRNIYLRPWLENLTGYYKLPETGTLHIYCYVPKTDRPDIDKLISHIEKYKDNDPSLWILPQTGRNIINKEKLSEISINYKTGIAVSLSKLGADLIIVSEKNMTEEDFLVARVKALTGAAVASCSAEGAQVTGVQDMHSGWDKVDLKHAGVLEFKLDTSKTRKKSFYDDKDFELLLSNKYTYK